LSYIANFGMKFATFREKLYEINCNPLSCIVLMRSTKGVNQVACHSFCSCFVANCFIVINVAVTFDQYNTNCNLLLFLAQSEAVIYRSFLDSLSPFFKECCLSATTPCWASLIHPTILHNFTLSNAR
jgi:hypothetical protein